MARKRWVVAVATVAALALVLAACSRNGTDTGGGTTGGQVEKGGIFRVQTDSFEWNAALDPTAEYLGWAFEFFNAIHRPLLQYNHKSGAQGGNELLPDTATDLGQVSEDGKTYTFKIKQGVKYAPPLNRQVTSADFKNAMTRLATPTLSAGGYPVFYRDIVGFTEVEAGDAKEIAGIETPDDETIVFKLKRPLGEFRFTLAMAATAPMPEEVTKCFDKNGQYGRYQIATGPYMIEGTDKLDVSSCDALRNSGPIAGFDPTKHLRIVRNPSYDPATDSPEARSNNIDGVTLTLNTNTDDIFKKIEAGEVDGESAQPPATVLARCQTDLKDLCHSDPGDRTWYIYMNLAMPPFDDVNVRKAVNFVMDKEGLVRVRGGRTGAGIVAEHIVPPDVLGGLLKPGEFDPYGPNHAGDVEKAKEAMKQSKYDTDKDGMCDAPECKGLIHNTRNTPPYTDMAPIIEQSLAKIGLEIQTKELDDFYATVQVPRQTGHMGSGAGWGKDYASASTFFVPLLSSGAINEEATQNFAYLGLTRAQAEQIGYDWPAGGVPSADAEINACTAADIEQANQCWADVDKKIMNEHVPWVPYLWADNFTFVSRAVTNYTYDQFAGEVSFVHIGIDTSKQR